MSGIESNYTSIGCLRKGAAGLGEKDAFIEAAGGHRFNEVYVSPKLSRLGWYQNERGIYVGYGLDEDLKLLRVQDGGILSYNVTEGCRGTPAFCPQTLYEESGTTEFNGFIDVKGVFEGDILHICVVARAPALSDRYPSDGDYTDLIRFVFWLNESSLGEGGIDLYGWGDMVAVEARVFGPTTQRQGGFLFPDGCWHTYDVIINKNSSASFFIDGICSYSGGENIWDGSLVDPTIQIYAQSRPDASYAVQSCSLEVYNAV